MKSQQNTLRRVRIPLRSAVGRAERLTLEAEIYRSLGAAAEEGDALLRLTERFPNTALAVDAVTRLLELREPTIDERLAFAEIAPYGESRKSLERSLGAAPVGRIVS